MLVLTMEEAKAIYNNCILPLQGREFPTFEFYLSVLIAKGKVIIK